MAGKMENYLARETRPWGNYQVLHASSGFQVKRVELNPASRLSLQLHNKREELWTIVAGEGIAVVNVQEIKVKRGSTVRIPIGEKHRIGNTGKVPLVFVEVQLGDYLGEDDIVRFQDDYNRL